MVRLRSLGSPTLSLVMIAKNEEKYLRRSLESVLGVVDEIVLVDTGSTDATKEIATSIGESAAADGRLPHGVKIVDFEWCDDFSAARNASLEAASGDWILMMDADEELFAGTSQINSLINQKQYHGFSARINIPHDTENLEAGNFEYYPSLRLFQNRPEHRFENVIHENLKVTQPENYADSAIEFLHFGVALDTPEDFAERQERNVRLLQAATDKDPENGYLLSCLGNEYMVTGDYENAYGAFMRSMQHSMGTEDQYIPPMLRDIAYCLIETGEIDRAEALLRDLQRQFPDYTDLFFLEGAIASSKGEIERARKLFAHCIMLGEPVKYKSFGGTGSWRVMGAMNQLGKES